MVRLRTILAIFIVSIAVISCSESEHKVLDAGGGFQPKEFVAYGVESANLAGFIVSEGFDNSLPVFADKVSLSNNMYLRTLTVGDNETQTEKIATVLSFESGDCSGGIAIWPNDGSPAIENITAKESHTKVIGQYIVSTDAQPDCGDWLVEAINSVEKMPKDMKQIESINPKRAKLFRDALEFIDNIPLDSFSSLQMKIPCGLSCRTFGVGPWEVVIEKTEEIQDENGNPRNFLAWMVVQPIDSIPEQGSIYDFVSKDELADSFKYNPSGGGVWGSYFATSYQESHVKVKLDSQYID